MNMNIQTWLKNRKSVEKSFNDYLSKGMLREESDLSLSSLHLKRARLDIEFSGYVIEEKVDHIHWGIVSSYYGAYHSAMALLSSKGYSSKSHIATICALIHLFYESGLSEDDILKLHKLNENSITNFDELKEKREMANYSVANDFEIIVAKRVHENAMDFINKVEEILEG